jgi:PleD family two-component response regulator
MSKRKIVVAVDDLFFVAKIRATGEALNAPLVFARTREEIMRAAAEDNPSGIIFDLQARGFDPFQVARELQSDEQLRHINLLGFYSHVQTELEGKAREAGFQKVMPRSAFSKRLAELLQDEGN